MSDFYARLQRRSYDLIIRQRREAERKKHSTGPGDPGRTEDEGVELVVSEIEAMLKGDPAYRMEPGDVEFVHGGADHFTEVEIRGRHYRITVEDLGPSGQAELRDGMARLSGKRDGAP